MPKAKGDVLKDPILKRIVEIIVKELEPDKIILFGSRARGDYKEGSDYDILVLKRGIKPQERIKIMWHLKKKISRLIPEKIFDIIVQDTEEYINLSKDPFTVYSSTQKEGVVIYEHREGERVA